MRPVLTAAPAAALASPAVAAENEAGTPSSSAVGTATSTIKVNQRNGSFDLQSHLGGRGEWCTLMAERGL